MSSATARRRGLLLFRILVAAALVALAVNFLRSQDPRALGRVLAGANGWWLALGALGNVLLVVSKALRMRLLVASSAPSPIAWPNLARAYLASYAADNLVMSQAGLAVRVALVHREGVPMIAAVAAQALDKLLEGATLLCLVPLAPIGSPLPAVVSHPGGLVAGALLVTLVVVALVRLGASRFTLLGRIESAGRVLAQPRAALSCAVLTLFGWAVEVAMVMTTLAALGLPASVPLGALVVLAVNFASLIPSLPANLGAFEAAAVVALTASGVDRTEAFGFALLYHALHTIPVTIAGLPDLRRVGRRDVPSDEAEEDRAAA